MRARNLRVANSLRKIWLHATQKGWPDFAIGSTRDDRLVSSTSFKD